MNPYRVSRRSMLAALGLGAGLVPLLGSRSVRGAPPPPPKRFIVMMMPNGFHDPDFLPVVAAASSPPPFYDPGAWSVSTAANAPLLPLVTNGHKKSFLDRVMLLGGIAFKNGQDTNNGSLGGHGSLPFLLSGGRGVKGPVISDGVKFTAGFPSVDRYLAMNLPGAMDLPFPSLVLRAMKFKGNDQFLSFDGPPLNPVSPSPNAPAPHDDPQALFASLFGGPPQGAAQAQRTNLERKSIFDVTGSQLTSLGQRLGTDDRKRIEQHIAATLSVEKQLASLSMGCAAPGALAPAPTGTDYTSQPGNQNIPAIVKANIDMTVAAMACDLTRVASIALSNSANNAYTPEWLKDKDPEFGNVIPPKLSTGGGPPPGSLWHHHAIAHNEGMYSNLKNYLDQWFISQLVYLMGELDSRAEPDGSTMLDNTLILFTNLQRTGGGHQTDDVKWMLAGNVPDAAGKPYFKSGRYVRWLGGTKGKGVSQSGVLAAIVQAMGCPFPGDYYGDPMTGPDYGGAAGVLRS